MYQVLHHQFVASALAVKAAHRINPEMKVGCMLAMVPLYPYSCNPDDVMFAQESMRERYVFTDAVAWLLPVLCVERVGTPRI